MRNELTVVCLACVVLVVLVNNQAECSPQLTFSTDWSGGRREAPSNEDLDLVHFDSNSDLINMDKRRPGWGKRAPGWGKRSEVETHDLKLKLTNLYKEYERRAIELKKMIELLDQTAK